MLFNFSITIFNALRCLCWSSKLFDKSFVQAEDFNAGSTALVQEEGTKTQYLINKNGEKASADYEEITPYGYSSNTNLEYYVVKKDGKYGLINLLGKELIVPKSTEIALYNCFIRKW